MALVSDHYPPELCGIGDYTDRLAQELRLRGTDVCVFTRKLDQGLFELREAGDVPVYRVSERWGFRDFRAVVSAAARTIKPMIFHIQYPSASGYERSLMINFFPLLLRLKRLNARCVVTVHEYHERSLQWRLRIAPMLAVNDGLVFVREVDRSAARKWLFPRVSRAAVIPVASNIPVVPISSAVRRQLRSKFGFSEKQTIILFFGNVYPNKGVLRILDVFEAARSAGFDVALFIVSSIGQPPSDLVSLSPEIALHQHKVLERLRPLINQGIAKTYYAPDKETASQAISVGDLAIFPFEGGASENRSSMIAAADHGLIVLTTRGRSTPVDFENTYGVRVVPAGDDTALAAKLCEILAEIESSAGQSSTKRRLQCYNVAWDRIARDTLEFYGRVAGDRRHGG